MTLEIVEEVFFVDSDDLAVLVGSLLEVLLDDVEEDFLVDMKDGLTADEVFFEVVFDVLEVLRVDDDTGLPWTHLQRLTNCWAEYLLKGDDVLGLDSEISLMTDSK